MLSVMKDAFGKAIRKPLTWIALVAIPVIVACFGLMYYGTFMDPFERMKSLPVAVINEDVGAQVDGESHNYGADLADSIMDNDKVKWVAEDASCAENGLENTDYFLAVVIPEDFSERVCAGQTSEPEQADITFYKNVRKNYTLSTMSSSIEAALRTTVNQKISEQYVMAYLEGLESAGEGMGAAAEGASALGEGIGGAQDGSAQLSDGASTLADGANTLEDGVGSLSSGAGQLASATGSLASGSNELASGLSDLASGAYALNAGVAAVSDGAALLAANGAALAAGAESVGVGVSRLSAGSAAFQQALLQQQSALAVPFGGDPAGALPGLQAAYAAALQQYASDIAVAVKTGQDPAAVSSAALEQAAAQLAQASGASGAYTALDQVISGYESVGGGIEQLAGGYSDLAAGVTAYVAASNQLAVGAQSAADGAGQVSAASASAQQGAGRLAAGAVSVDEGAGRLAAGAASAQSGAAQLASGASSLRDGAATLADGLQDAQDGTGQLASSLSEGQQTVSDALTESPADLAKYAAEPVTVTDNAYGNLDKFGYGFAPLFLSLSLWLGALLIFFILDPFPSREHLGASRFAAVFGRWPAYLVFSAAEGAVVFSGSLVLGLPLTSVGVFALVIGVVCFSFMCILQLLNLFDTPGKAVGVLLVVFQLVCCSGTLPAELGSDFAVAAGPCLPFYYSIDALREVLSGGVFSTVFADLGTLLLFAVAAVALSLLTYPRALALKRKRDAAMVESITGKSLAEI